MNSTKKLVWIRTMGAAVLALVGSSGSPAVAQRDDVITSGTVTLDGITFKDGVEVPKIATERAPYDPTLTDQTVTFYEKLVEKKPKEFIERRELAGAYLTRQRERGDIADAVRAEQAAKASLKLQTTHNSLALIRLAQATLAQHRFPEALAMAQDAAKSSPHAERLIIDIQLELGNYDAATQRLQGLPSEPDDMNLLALRARFAELRGKSDESISLMREAAGFADNRPDMAAETVAWYHTMVGHHLIDSGHLEEGEKACRKALKIFPNDYRAMTGLAEAAAWRGDHAGALRWANDAIKLSAQNPEALRLAGEAYAGMGKTTEANHQFQALRDLAGSFPRIYDRHWANFLLDTDQEVETALALARKDLELRHDVGAHETLAYACLKNGLLDEADHEMTLAMEQGTQEAGMYQHASRIAEARGDKAKAATLLARAKALNPYLVKSNSSSEPTSP